MSQTTYNVIFQGQYAPRNRRVRVADELGRCARHGARGKGSEEGLRWDHVVIECVQTITKLAKDNIETLNESVV